VELDVSQNDFAKVAPNQPCWIVTDAYPDKKYQGAVDLISPEANRQKATVQVRVKVLNPDELLKPDMNATVSFLSPRKLAATRSASTVPQAERPAIRVPASAVRDGAVFVVEDGKAVRREVAVGENARGGEVEATKGLVQAPAPASAGASNLLASPPKPPARWTFVVHFPPARRQAALDELGDIDRTVEIVSECLLVYRDALQNGVEKYLQGRSIKPVYRRFN
jgi:multidrug efflux pump subunit AcrA (membrane-fusion protein)